MSAATAPAATYADELASAGFDRKQVITLMEQDLNFFAPTVIPEVFTCLFPQVHIEVWQLLKEYVHKPKTFFKLALGLPRGHAKTTLIKLFILYCILFTNKQFVLICGASASLAENILADVSDMLSHPNIVQIYGNWKAPGNCEKDTQSVKKFVFVGRSIVLAAIGAGTSLRGLNIKNVRPDVLICDDVQSAEDCESDTTSDKLLRWLLGTLFKAKSPRGCLYIYIGNMFRGPNCVLAKLKKSSEWISFVVGALLSDGSSIWPELHSAEDLVQELQHDISLGKPEIFFAEVQNDPDAGVTSTFDVTKVPEYPLTEYDLITGGFIIIDPSGTKVNSDDTAIGYFACIEQRVVFRDLIVGNLTPLQAIEAGLQLGFKYNCPLIFVESTAYQSSFLYWFTFICEQRGISGYQLFELYSRSVRKAKRIVEFFKKLLSGEILLHPKVRAAVLYQAINWKPQLRDNVDDVLDLGGYVDYVLSDFEPIIHNLVSHILQTLGGEDKVIEDCSSF